MVRQSQSLVAALQTKRWRQKADLVVCLKLQSRRTRSRDPLLQHRHRCVQTLLRISPSLHVLVVALYPSKCRKCSHDDPHGQHHAHQALYQGVTLLRFAKKRPHKDQLVCQQRWRLGHALGIVPPISSAVLIGQASSNCTLLGPVLTNWVCAPGRRSCTAACQVDKSDMAHWLGVHAWLLQLVAGTT